MRVIVDRERAKQVFDALLERYKAREFPYNLPAAQVPQIPENLPKNGFSDSRGHASFLFSLCFWMRGGIDSSRATRAVSVLHEQRPEMFRAEHARTMDPSEVSRILTGVTLGFNSREIGRFWVQNFGRLQDYWGGDPSNVFQGVRSYDEICQRVCNPKGRLKRMTPRGETGFLGFQEKMASMLTYFLLDARLIKPLPFPLPVDFHVLRMVVAHEIITVEDGNGDFFNQEVLAAVRELSLWYSEYHGGDSLDMSTILWCFSRAMCSRYPGNTTLYIGPRRGRKTKLLPKKITWRESQRRAYAHTCGQCPVEPTCKHSIPAAHYYVQGKLLVRATREKPQEQLRLYEPNGFLMPPAPRDWQKPVQNPDTTVQFKLFE